MKWKVFTVDEANDLLPSMEELFRLVDGLRDRLRRDADRLKVLDVLWGPALRKPDNPDREEFLERRAAVRNAVAQLEGLVDREIQDRGIRFPPGGLTHGLLDFPTVYQGRWVFLCWKRGETRIEAWHEVEAGYRGRRPLRPEEAARMGADGEPRPPGPPPGM